MQMEHSSAITINKTAIATETVNREAAVLGLQNNINSNTVSINNNTNVVAIATNATEITNNQFGIVVNQDRIDSNTVGIAVNQDGIVVNETNIATNTTSIASNDTDIASLSTAVISLQTSSALSINHVSETFNSTGELFCYDMESIQVGIPANCSTQNIFRKTLECPNNSKALSGGCRLNMPSLWSSGGGSYLSNFTSSSSHTCVYDGDTDFTMTIFVNCLN